ncbi:hypothetical protein [Dokdonella soli]|uniref:hypothetical protein n=1 Tax=Dokdonella soli TaxID=529810 RepID=UPI0031DD8C8E
MGANVGIKECVRIYRDSSMGEPQGRSGSGCHFLIAASSNGSMPAPKNSWSSMAGRLDFNGTHPVESHRDVLLTGHWANYKIGPRVADAGLGPRQVPFPNRQYAGSPRSAISKSGVVMPGRNDLFCVFPVF